MPDLTQESQAANDRPDQAILDRRGNRRTALAAALLAAATLAVYCNSLGGPFIFDDEASIPGNPTLQHLAAIRTVLSPPTNGITVSGRPVLNLSLAINYALGQTRVPGYHLTNLAIHILAGLVLLGIVRRTLLLPSMRGAMLPSSPLRASVGTEACPANTELPRHASEDGSMAPYLAAAISLLWMVHPLQTESVTYIIQRAESLMGLFYLLTLYCVIRSASSGAILWPLAAVAACAAGMATKEVMVTAPVIVLLYDRTFLAGSFAGALRKRWRLYAALAACWALLACLMAAAGNRGETAGFGAKDVPGWWSYAQMECWAIVKYLLLTVCPDSLCLDYGAPTWITLWQIVPDALIVASIALASLWGLWRGRKWGFLGACFLAILAPTSSFVPLRDPVFEHRMYLPLAAALTAAVLAALRFWEGLSSGPNGSSGRPPAWRRVVPAVFLAVAVASLGSLTLLRNHDYRSARAIWEDTVAKAQANGRARLNLGCALMSDPNELPRAVEQFRRAIALDPADAEANSNLGAALPHLGQLDEAAARCRRALELKPDLAEAHNNLGNALSRQGKLDEAAACFRRAVKLKPDYVEAYYNLGNTLSQQGKLDEAAASYGQALKLNGDYAEAHNNLGAALVNLGKFNEAIDHLRQAIRLNPRFPEAYMNLSVALKRAGRDAEATQAMDKANALKSSQTAP